MEGPSTNLKEKFSVFGEKLKVGSGELSRKVSERMSTVSEKMKELFQVPTQADKLVEDATGENLQFADWEKNLEICDLVNLEKVSGQDTARAIKKRIMLKSTQVQYLALTLLETCVKNCEKMFSEVASEKVLDEMVKMVDDPATPSENRDKALKLIEAWGESTEELRYLPIFEETYKSLKSRGIRFPGRDEESLAPIFTPPQSVSRSASEALYGSAHGHGHAQPRDLSASVGHDMRFEVTKEVFDVARNSVDLLNTVLTSSPQQEVLREELTLTLVEQCRSSQFKVQRIVESTGDADPVLFEALNVNDDLQRVLTKYEEMWKGASGGDQQQQQQQQQGAQPAKLTLADVQALDEEDSHQAPEEASSLVRKRETKPSASPSSAHDDAAIADLDEMIFGNKSAEGSSTHLQTPKRQNTEDMIMF